MTEHKNGYITEKQSADYVILSPLLDSLYREFQELSKKKPQDVLNQNKVKVVNRVLIPTLELLKQEPTFSFLDVLNDDDLPQNSDVILMLGQFEAAMRSFKIRHYDGRNGWHVKKDI